MKTIHGRALRVRVHPSHVRPDSQTVRVIVDVRDGGKDRWIPIDQARELFDAGILAWDVTNQAYCTPTNGVVPKEMQDGQATLTAQREDPAARGA